MKDLFKSFEQLTFRNSLLLSIIFFIASILLDGKINEFSFSLFLPVFLVTISLLFFYRNQYKSTRKFLLNLISFHIFISLITTIVLTFILETYNGYPFLSLKDDYNYYNSAVEISRRWEMNGISVVNDIKLSTGFYSGYPNISALAIYLFGESIYVLKSLNIFISCLLLYYTYKTIILISSSYYGKLLTSILAFSPLLSFFSSFILKDIILLFLTVVVIYGWIKIFQKKAVFLDIAFIILSLVLMIFFRAATILPLIISFLITYVINFVKFRKEFSFKSIFSTLIIVILFFWFWNYLSTTLNIVSESETYYSTRYESVASKDVTNQIFSNFGYLIAIVSPALLFGSLFLPGFMFLDLGNAETINYTVAIITYHLVFLPFIIEGIIFSVRKFRKLKPEVMFLLFVFILLKVGLLASVNSLFSVRQSLGAIFIMYLFVPFAFAKGINSKRINIYFTVSIIFIFLFNISRMLINS